VKCQASLEYAGLTALRRVSTGRGGADQKRGFESSTFLAIIARSRT